jgi:hypothetical protein
MSFDKTPEVPESPATVQSDAKDRAWRTLIQGLLLDLSVAIVLVLAPAVSAVEWTSEYWTALGLLVAKSAVQSLVSYLMRTLVKPKAAV